MRIVDLIAKKRDGGALSDEEIKFFAQGVTNASIPDYQTASMLMAIYLNGMNEHETAVLTYEMARSGDMVDLSEIKGIKVDKHSTGGVGDKTTLIIVPIVASFGVPVAKMSGRGLGHTGGTVDKLESIPGLKTEIGKEEFFKIVNQVGACVIGQSGNIAPADKKLYALRDVTATVGNLSLISSSIMSKKLAAGSDAILLDVKVGGGAFMKTVEAGFELAKAMVAIGEANGRRMGALITDMDIPLGNAIGNSLEIVEVVETLKGKGPADLTEVALALAANMLHLAEKGSLEDCFKMSRAAIEDGSALLKLREMVVAQGGDGSYIDDVGKLEKAPVAYDVKAQKDGFIVHIDTMKYGEVCVILGAGRATKEDKIDFSAGIYMRKKTGDPVKKGEILATLYTSREALLPEAEGQLQEATLIGSSAPDKPVMIHGRVGRQR